MSPSVSASIRPYCPSVCPLPILKSFFSIAIRPITGTCPTQLSSLGDMCYFLLPARVTFVRTTRGRAHKITRAQAEAQAHAGARAHKHMHADARTNTHTLARAGAHGYTRTRTLARSRKHARTHARTHTHAHRLALMYIYACKHARTCPCTHAGQFYLRPAQQSQLQLLPAHNELQPIRAVWSAMLVVYQGVSGHSFV